MIEVPISLPIITFNPRKMWFSSAPGGPTWPKPWLWNTMARPQGHSGSSSVNGPWEKNTGSSEMLVLPGMRKIYGDPYIKCLLPFVRQTSHVPSFPTSSLPRFYTSYAYAWPRCVVMSISRTFTKMRGRMVILRSLKKSVAPSTLKRSCYDFFLWKPPETAFDMPTNANRKCNVHLAWCEKESDPFIPSLHLCQVRTNKTLSVLWKAKWLSRRVISSSPRWTDQNEKTLITKCWQPFQVPC